MLPIHGVPLLLALSGGIAAEVGHRGTCSLKFAPSDELESQHQDCPSEGESYYVAHPNL